MIQQYLRAKKKKSLGHSNIFLSYNLSREEDFSTFEFQKGGDFF